MYVPFLFDFFQGLSLALRSHDQFKASHQNGGGRGGTNKQNIFFLRRRQKQKKSIGVTIRIGREILCLSYAGFFNDSIVQVG